MKTLPDGYIIAKKDLYNYLNSYMSCRWHKDENVNKTVNMVLHYIMDQENGSSFSKTELKKKAVDTVYDKIIEYDNIDEAVDSISKEYDNLIDEIRGIKGDLYEG